MAGDGSDSKIKIIREKLDKGYLRVVSLQADIRKTNSTAGRALSTNRQGLPV